MLGTMIVFFIYPKRKIGIDFSIGMIKEINTNRNEIIIKTNNLLNKLSDKLPDRKYFKLPRR